MGWKSLKKSGLHRFFQVGWGHAAKQGQFSNFGEFYRSHRLNLDPISDMIVVKILIVKSQIPHDRHQVRSARLCDNPLFIDAQLGRGPLH